MNKNLTNSITIFFLFCIIFTSQAQKVKYKDVYFIIHKTKKYKQGEPFLRSYLSNPKNKANPHAPFLMAEVYRHKSDQLDLLKESSKKRSLLDSAVFFYSKSKELVNDKSVSKKYKDYYEEDYMRRDLRTGKIAVKAADVILDLDKKIKEVMGTMSSLTKVDKNFQQARDDYNKALELFGKLAISYPSERVFMLQADDEALDKCANIASTYSSARKAFVNYKKNATTIKNFDFEQTLVENKIKNLKAELTKTTDFYAKNVEVYELASWSNKMINNISNMINPTKEKLINYDQKLNSFREKLFADSTSVVKMIKNENGNNLHNDILKYDSKGMPATLLKIKEKELEYWSYVFENNKKREDASIIEQVEMASQELKAISAVDSLINVMLEYDMTVEVENYKTFINRNYQGKSGLQKFINQKQNLAKGEKSFRENVLQTKIKRSQQLIYGKDEIPLTIADSTQSIVLSTNRLYITLGEVALDETPRFIYGMRYDPKGNVHGYSTVVPGNLVAKQINTSVLDKNVFAKHKYSNLKVQAKQSGDLFYILYYDNSEFQNKPKKGHLDCIDFAGKLKWSINLNLDYPLDNITPHSDSGIAINYNIKYIDTQDSKNHKARVLINKLGKKAN